jgi:glutathione S-transferase
VIDSVDDLRQQFGKVLYPPGSSTPEAREALLKLATNPAERGGGHLTYLENFVARHGAAYIAGTAEPTIADYHAFASFGWASREMPEFLSTSPKLAAWLQAFAQRPRIAAYLAALHAPKTA